MYSIQICIENVVCKYYGAVQRIDSDYSEIGFRNKNEQEERESEKGRLNGGQRTAPRPRRGGGGRARVHASPDYARCRVPDNPAARRAEPSRESRRAIYLAPRLDSTHSPSLRLAFFLSRSYVREPRVAAASPGPPSADQRDYTR